MLTFAKSHFQVGIMVCCSHPYYFCFCPRKTQCRLMGCLPLANWNNSAEVQTTLLLEHTKSAWLPALGNVCLIQSNTGNSAAPGRAA